MTKTERTRRRNGRPQHAGMSKLVVSWLSLLRLPIPLAYPRYSEAARPIAQAIAHTTSHQPDLRRSGHANVFYPCLEMPSVSCALGLPGSPGEKTPLLRIQIGRASCRERG